MSAAWKAVMDGCDPSAVDRDDCVAWLGGLPADSLDLIFASPPYADARLYLEDGEDLGIARDCQEWVSWMLEVSIAAQRACRGPVFWVCAGVTRDRNYWPACEGLSWEWWKRGGDCQLYRPCVFHRVGIPGSGGDDYLRQDWEYILCMKRPGRLQWSENTACGSPPKYGPGGKMTHRLKNGKRVHESVFKAGHRSGKDGERQGYTAPDVANPGNVVEQAYTATEVSCILSELGDVVDCIVGGGHMGSPIARHNEAPFPLPLAEFFVRSFCPPGGIVADCFSGSGTTAAAAKKWGRRFVGCDLRESQVTLSGRRIEQEQPLMFTEPEGEG